MRSRSTDRRAKPIEPSCKPCEPSLPLARSTEDVRTVQSTDEGGKVYRKGALLPLYKSDELITIKGKQVEVIESEEESSGSASDVESAAESEVRRALLMRSTADSEPAGQDAKEAKVERWQR